MAVDHLFTFFILLLIANTGFSVDTSIFVQTGASVQLDIQTQEQSKINVNVFLWEKDKSTTIVTYITATNQVLNDNSYKNRVKFNAKTFSLTLKNMQKTDNAVEAPVLTVNSNWSSSDSCTVSFTCRAHEIMINSSYQNNRCSPEEKYIMCNHSNPVSWKEDRINIKQLCSIQQIQLSYSSSYMMVLVVSCVVVGVMVFAALILYCCCKNETGVKQADDTGYDDVETLTQKMTGDTWTTVTYCAAGHQTPSSVNGC
ncbi:hypothetical protein Q8A67_008611 [Cirrhinus molitorella]|uniref:Immunoglobulin V-set domain-containing protein n=1 Tax=Cirrhinus molitorella TaxID=172907 RepID=A0AA88Q292_9TELE|nr:hypothetical protein Q8A67_008611 [Cirrhinus molitorella]